MWTRLSGSSPEQRGEGHGRQALRLSAGPPAAELPGEPDGVGAGSNPELPGLADGALASSTMTPGMSVSVQPGSIWFGAYASD